MAETFKLTNKFTPNLEKRAVFTLSDKFQPSEELLRQQAETAKQRALQSGLDKTVSAVSADLKSGTNSVGKRKMSAGLDYYVNGNPIPSKNPAQGVAGVNKAAEDYAKKATSGDGYEKYSLSELEKLFKDEDKRYNGDKGVQGYQGNFVTNTLDFIGNTKAWEEQQKQVSNYKALKTAYENRKAAYTDYKASQKYGTQNAEEAIELLKERKKQTEDSTVKKSIDNEIKELRQGLYGDSNVFASLGKGIKSGAHQILKGIASTGDMTLGNLSKALGFKNNPFSATNEYYNKLYSDSQRETQRSSNAWGDKYNISGQIAEGVTAALPDAILAVVTGGQSAAPKMGEASLTLGNAVKTSVENLIKNPFYWTSFARELGGDYEDAKANGATEAEATAYALLASTVNAVVEVGGDTGYGGIQTLPEALKNTGGKKNAILEWVRSMFDEGKEEVVQGVISQLTEGAVYDKDKKLYSSDDENAVINPARMLKEGAMGAAVGGILGGGQLTFSNIVNSRTSGEYKSIGKQAKKSGDIDGVINYAARSANTDIRALAVNTDSESISDETAGQLYAYACRDIDEAISSPADLNTAIDNFNEIAGSTDSKLINGIASSRLIERLTSEGIDSESAEYIIDDNESGVKTDIGKSENETDNSINDEFGTKSAFTEYSAKKYKADPIESYMAKEHGREKLSDDQLQIVMVARKLGHSVVFEDTAKTRGFKSDGYIENDGTIHIDYDNTKPVQFVFKHELTHYAEGSELYKNFVETVKASKTYSKWIAQKVSGEDSAAVKSAKYRQSVIDGYAASGIELTPMQAESELIADFVGDTLFTEDGSGLESIMSDMNAKQRKSFIQYIKDFFAYIKDKLSRNKTATSDILRLEKMFNETLSTVEQKNTADEGEVKYSFAGERAANADKSLLEIAKQRIESGEDSEAIRKETGWFKGYDGKWRFEIDDSNIKYYPGGDALFTKDHPEYAEYRNLEKKFIYGTLTDEENNRLKELNEIWGREHNRLSKLLTGGVSKLRDIIDHDVLFKNYPQLEKTTVVFDDLPEGTRGEYNNKQNKIILSNAIRNSNKTVVKTLIHEVQHAVQHIEGFATGSNTDYWANKLLDNALKEKNQIKDEILEKADSIAKDTIYMYDEYIERLSYKDDISETEFAKAYDRAAREISDENIEELFFDYAEANEKYYFLKKNIDTKSMIAYMNTAGEIESRDVSNRLDYTSEQRKNTRPDIDRTDVVFAESAVSYFSAKESNNSSIKQQLREHLKEVNAMLPVAEVQYSPTNKKNLRAQAVQEFKKIGYKVERQGFGVIEIGDKQIEKSLEYITTDGERAALLAVPKVLKRGIVISGHKDHKGRSYGTVTIAAPVSINGKIGDIAVVVKITGKNRYSTHRILMPDGSEFVFEENKNTEPTSSDMLAQKSDQGTDISSVFDNTVPQKAQSVNTSISENSENSTKRFSIPFNQAELLDKYDRGEISREEYLNQSNENWKEAVNNYGTIETGENPVNDIPVPKSVDGKQKTQRFARTVIESGKLTNRMVEDMGADILLGKFAYTPVSDESAQAAADKAVNGGFAESSWQETVNASKQITKDKIAIGEKLLMQAIANKDTKRALELSSELADVLTRNGQNIQAASMFKKMTGAGKLLTVQQYVNTLNKDLEAKYGENAPTVKVNELIAQQIAESKPGEDIYSIYEDALQDVAAQVPATFLDKWNAWRYMSMLVNPTTHIRNIVGNGLFIPSVRMKDFISASLETAFITDKDKRTKSVVIKKEYKEFAKKDLSSAEVKNALKSGGKFNIETEISERQRIFKNNVLEFVRVGNGNLLEAEDLISKNIHYKHALAGFLQARGADLNNIDENLLWEARAYAVQEAMKATFNDANSISTALSAAANKNKALNIAINGVLPFKKTPVNIVRRGVEYSPIGLLKTVVKGSYDLKQGKITASEYIDGLGAGISGTVVFALGALLSSLGWATGGFGDDDEDKFKKLNGEQEYALQFWGKSYTIDWAAPACIPFFIGVETVNALREDNDDFKLSDITEAMWNSLEPVINLSMLSGVQSMIESVKYAAEDKSVISLAGNIAKSYFSQGLPTVLGKTARTLDSKRRSNYIDKNSQLSEFSQSAINTAKSKIPGLEATRPEYINAWGQAESNGNIAERIFGNFVSPGYYSEGEYNEMSQELLRLSKKVKSEDVNVFPKTAQKSFEVNGKTKHLTAEEYTKYAKAKGRYSYDYVSEFVNSAEYKKLTDLERAKVINNLYKYANAKAKTEVSDYDITKSFKTVSQWDKRGKSPVIYYIGRVLAEK